MTFCTATFRKSICSVAFASFVPAALAAPVAEGFEFNGYWRAGFNTGANPTEGAPDTQGGTGAPTSRHIKSPSYYRLGFAKNFENKMRVEFAVDSEASFPHQNNVWSGLEAPRVRDLFLQLPVGDSSNIWAGSRRLEYEDVRLLDFNPLSMNAFGVGGDAPIGTWALSAMDESDPSLSKRKTLTAMYRKPLSLGEGSSLTPAIFVTHRGRERAGDVTTPATPTVPASTRPEAKAMTDVKAGVTYSYFGEGYWANNFLVVETLSSQVGTTIERDLKYSIAQSGSYNLSEEFGILTGLSLDVFNYKTERNTFKIENDAHVADGTTKSKTVASVALQPVYFATDRTHIALDLNYTHQTKLLAVGEANAWFVTPILRYAMEKNTLGTPQIYTSMTYGKYAAKVKRNFKNEATDSLVTTQTGFEVWF